MHVDSDPEDDNDTCEEWERHEALHNDVQPNRSGVEDTFHFRKSQAHYKF